MLIYEKFIWHNVLVFFTRDRCASWSACFFIHLLFRVCSAIVCIWRIWYRLVYLHPGQRTRWNRKDFYKLLKGWLSTMLQWFLTITIFLLGPFCVNFYFLFLLVLLGPFGPNLRRFKVLKRDSIAAMLDAHQMNEVN